MKKTVKRRLNLSPEEREQRSRRMRAMIEADRARAGLPPLKPRPGEDGWVEWDGGGIKVDDMLALPTGVRRRDLVDVVLRSGYKNRDEAGQFRWWHEPVAGYAAGDIVRYRLLSAAHEAPGTVLSSAAHPGIKVALIEDARGVLLAQPGGGVPGHGVVVPRDVVPALVEKLIELTR